MKVVVTGASGHVGATLVRALLARGDQVRVVAHPATNTSAALEGLDVDAVVGDVCDPASLRAAFAGCELVFHLAGLISIDGDRDGLVRKVNVDGAGHVASAALASGVRRLVHMSSVHAFDHHPVDAPLDESRARPGAAHPAYDRSKAAGEEAVRAVVAQGLDAVIVNPSGIIGPFDFAPSRMGQVLLYLAGGKLPALGGGGFDWVDVRDVASGAMAAADRGRTGQNYLLSGHYHSMQELARMASAITGVPPPPLFVPAVVEDAAAVVATAWSRLRGTRPHLTSEALHALRGSRNVVGARAAAELGHKPRPTHETLADAYAWFIERGTLNAFERRTPL
ncbi:MAG: NAD-dependent epimerase/dehydratase family protein [Deltaproteobacteria bacterium]|nr:NAD-dependent epimerase/dehydratase family protein [Deltaproteobacteria bacterium]